MRKVTADTHTWLAARNLLLDRSDDFFLQLARCREALAAEAIHDLRVATRRLREGIALFGHCFRKRQLTALRKELKSLTTKLGSIRNTDEALLFFSPLGEQSAAASTPAILHIVANLRTSRVAEQRLLKQELNKIDPDSLLGKIAAICQKPRIFNPNTSGLFQPIAAYLLEALSGREKTMLELLPEALHEENVAQQHKLRIAVKRFRYRTEFLAPLTSGGYKQVYAAIKEYQEILGHLHDLDVFSNLSGEITTDPAGRQLVKEIISDRRQLLFAAFLQLQTANPLQQITSRVRGLL